MALASSGVTGGVGCGVTGGADCGATGGAGCGATGGGGFDVTGGAGCGATGTAGSGVTGGADCGATGGASCGVTGGPNRHTAAIAITPKVIALPAMIRHGRLTVAALGCSLETRSNCRSGVEDRGPGSCGL